MDFGRLIFIAKHALRTACFLITGMCHQIFVCYPTSQMIQFMLTYNYTSDAGDIIVKAKYEFVYDSILFNTNWRVVIWLESAS